MKDEARELHRFLTLLMKDPRDVVTRRILADWFDDHDEPELADEQRQWDLKKYDAVVYLKAFAKKYYRYRDYEEMIEEAKRGEVSFSDEDGPGEARCSEFWEAIEAVTGEEVSEEKRAEARFRCAC